MILSAQRNLKNIFNEEMKLDSKKDKFDYHTYQNTANWERISELYFISEDLLIYVKDKVNWEKLVKNGLIHDDTLLTFQTEVDWDLAIKERNLSQEFIDQIEVYGSKKKNISLYKEWLKLYGLLKNLGIISSNFREFKENIDWKFLCKNYDLSENFIRSNLDKIEWVELSSNYRIPRNILCDFADRINWTTYNIERLSQQQIKDIFPKVSYKKCLAVFSSKKNENKYCFITNGYGDFIQKNDLMDECLLRNYQICNNYVYYSKYLDHPVLVEIEPVDNEIYDVILYFEHDKKRRR